MGKRIFLVGFFGLMALISFGQGVDSLAFVEMQDSVRSLSKELAKLNEDVQPLISSWQWLLGGIAVIASILTFFGIQIGFNLKKTVNNLIEKQAN